MFSSQVAPDSLGPTLCATAPNQHRSAATVRRSEAAQTMPLCPYREYLRQITPEIANGNRLDVSPNGRPATISSWITIAD